MPFASWCWGRMAKFASGVVFRRLLIKLSGEAFLGESAYGISEEACAGIALELKRVVHLGVQVGLVVGGGNIFRGSETSAMARPTADTMGMLATVINALALAEALGMNQVKAEVHSALAIGGVVAPYDRKEALRQLEDGHVVIFAGGTGNPFFTTDTAAVLRGLEVGADAVVKATKVDGIYSADPLVDKSASRFSRLSFDEVLSLGLKVMDATAFTLCREHQVPVCVVSMHKPGVLLRVVLGEEEGSWVGR